MNELANKPLELPRAEVLKLGAVDSIFYCREFFPKTFRQGSPDYHRDYWAKFEDPQFDFFAAEIFRGGAKTTLTRAGISKRIAYAVSRNILCVAISESMALHTVRWIKRQVLYNRHWSETFMLRPGTKWSDDWIEIINEPFDCTINVIAKGMTSGLRGLNPDDWRPDFIMADDISNEETTGTEEQRMKNRDLFFGALVPTLAAKSEAPLRKLVLNQTGLHRQDIVNLAHEDPTFCTVKYPKLVETQPGVFASAWEARYPTAECLGERDAYIQRNQYHIYLREYGCKIISRETNPFNPDWLRKWTILPVNLKYYIGLDPATNSDKKQAHKTAIVVIGVNPTTGDVYLIDYFAQKGKNPDEMWIWLLDKYIKFRPQKVGSESVAFQKMLIWYFQTKMQEAKTFFHITPIDDRRSKPDRIVQAHSGLCSQGKFWVNPNHLEFISGFTDWDGTKDWDLGDACAQAIVLANPWMAQGASLDVAEGEEDYLEDEKNIPELVYEGGAP